MSELTTDRLEAARFAVAVIFTVMGCVVGSWAPHIALIAERLTLGPGVLGAVLLAAAVGALVGMPVTGKLISRFGSAPVTRMAAAVMCLSLPLPVLAPNVELLSASLFIFGMSIGITDVAMNAHAVAVEARLARPIMSSLHGMFSVGGLLGAGVTSMALAVMSASSHALLAGGLLVATVAIGGRRLLPAAVDAGATGATFVLPRRVHLALGILACLALLTEGAVLDWSAVYLHDRLGAGASQAGWGFAAFSAAMAIGRFVGDKLRRRFGAAKLVRVNGIVTAFGLLLALLVTSPTLAVIGFALAGLGLANVVPVLFGAAGRLPGQAPGASIAAVATLGYLGFIVGPPLIGLVTEIATLQISLGLLVLASTAVAFGAGVVRNTDG